MPVGSPPYHRDGRGRFDGAGRASREIYRRERKDRKEGWDIQKWGYEMDEVNRAAREISRRHYSKPKYPLTVVDKLAMTMLTLIAIMALIVLIYTGVMLQP